MIPPKTVSPGIRNAVMKMSTLWSCCVSAIGSARSGFGGSAIRESWPASH